VMSPALRAGLGGAACLLLCLGGCAPKPPSGYEQAQAAEDAFAAGADRPPTPRTLYAMSHVLAGQGKVDEQAAVLRRVIQQQRNFLPAYNDLAQLQLTRHDPQGALATLQQGMQIAPSDPILVNNAGMCRLFMRDYAGALERFNQAAALAPREGRYRANAALALSMLGRYDESLAMYNQVLRPAQAHYNLGVMYQGRQQLLEALREYEMARKLESGEADEGYAAASPPASQPASQPASSPASLPSGPLVGPATRQPAGPAAVPPRSSTASPRPTQLVAPATPTSQPAGPLVSPPVQMAASAPTLAPLGAAGAPMTIPAIQPTTRVSPAPASWPATRPAYTPAQARPWAQPRLFPASAPSQPAK